MADTKKIVLGSGKLYVTTATVIGGVYTIPSDSTLETDSNLLGLISGGASVEYKPTFYEAKDDLGLVSEKIITDEEATLKSGVMTWNGNTLKKLIATATVTEDSEHKTRTVKIGGIGNYDGLNYVIRFVHTDAVAGNVRVTIVGSNTGGFEMSFAKDKETVINAEFTAIPNDANGTLIVYTEDMA